jgi:hypothetical protein
MNPWVAFIIGGLTGYAVRSTQKDKNSGRHGQRALPPGPSAFVLGPACSEWEIVDQPKANLLVRKAYIDSRLAGETDPYKLTAAVIGLTAPKCHTPAKGIRNSAELDLYTSFFDSIFGLLEDDGIYTEAEMAQIQAQFQTWHDQQAAVLGR